LVAGFADPSDIVVDASDADLSYYVNLAAISAFNHYSELSFVALVEGKKKKKKNLLWPMPPTLNNTYSNRRQISFSKLAPTPIPYASWELIVLAQTK